LSHHAVKEYGETEAVIDKESDETLIPTAHDIALFAFSGPS
jgi:hypothetical protein